MIINDIIELIREHKTEAIIFALIMGYALHRVSVEEEVSNRIMEATKYLDEETQEVILQELDEIRASKHGCRIGLWGEECDD